LRARIALIAIVAIVVGAAGAVLLTGSDDADAEVILEPTAAEGEDPFTDSVAKSDAKVRGGGFDRVRGGDASIESVRGSAAGLYGGTGDQAVCDADALVAFLKRNPDKAAAFAGVLGIRPSGIEDYVSKLTPLLLREDTRVTNHGFSGGRATSLQSVLQAGTAVLVDDRGVPRVRCACGNPLTEPAAVSSAPEFRGARWDGFDDDRLVAISESRTVVNEFVVVNVRTGERYRTSAGSADTRIEMRDDLLGAIGRWVAVGRSNTVAGASREFGSDYEVGQFCVTRWRRARVTAYVSFGSGGCIEDGNAIVSVRIESSRYATMEGLRVGMSEADVKRLYPGAELLRDFQDNPNARVAPQTAYALVTKPHFTGTDAPTLTAVMDGDRVVALSAAALLLD
jgi:hypothetical protein